MTLAPLKSFKKRIHTLIFTIGWLANLIAWSASSAQGVASLPQHLLCLIGFVLMPLLAYLIWKPDFPAHLVDALTVLYVAGISAACIGLGFYSPYSGDIPLEALYLWIPVMYLFTFSLGSRRQAALYSAGLWLLLFAISLPFLLKNPSSQEAYLNVQLHLMSIFIIVAFFYFSTYQQQLRLARLSVDELATLANTDELTQLANRRRLEELMTLEQLRFARYGHPYTLILLDIDHFKQFNDNFGHDLGDKILRALARRVQETLREVDTLARWGGEELVVLLPETGLDEALKKAESICQCVRQTALVDQHSITLSCGVAEVGEGDDVASLFKRADEALYRAKDNGRDQVQGVLAERAAVSVA